jgi:hypothetical protein
MEGINARPRPYPRRLYAYAQKASSSSWKWDTDIVLSFETILNNAGIDPSESLVIRHVFIKEHEDSSPGLSPNSTYERIMEYTTNQSLNTRSFPAKPPRFWIVFIAEGSNRARLWSVVENHGLVSSDEHRRIFNLTASDAMADLNNRLVIGWRVATGLADNDHHGSKLSCPGNRRCCTDLHRLSHLHRAFNRAGHSGNLRPALKLALTGSFDRWTFQVSQ